MITSQEFSRLFLPGVTGTDLYLFNEAEGAIGFSVFREYPVDGLAFRPVRSQKGAVDSVALIKIYFLLQEVNREGRYPIYAWVGAASRYLLEGRMLYNYEDLDSPSSQEVENWQKSLKPAELFDNDYFFDPNTRKLVNKDGEMILPSTFIEDIFKKHIKTAQKIKGIPFRLKLNTRNFFSDRPLVVCRSIRWLNRVVFSRDINKDTRSFDSVAYEVFLKPIPHGLFKISQPSALKIFGTELPVSKNSVVITPFLFLLLSIIAYFKRPPFSEAYFFIFNGNTFLATSAVIVWFVIFDNWFPHALLFISNRIVVITSWFRNKKIKV